MKAENHEQTIVRRRKILVTTSLIVLLTLTVLLTVILWRFFVADNEMNFRRYIEQFGLWAPLIFLLAQMLQIFLPLLPGEVMEISAGVLFGAVEGTLLCLGGILVASSAVFWLTRRFGRSFLNLYFDVDKLYESKWLSSETHIKRLLFLLFFIPGTPKDLLTFFAPLSRITLPEFLWISMIARIPSVISSTVGGHFLVEGDYITAGIIFLATAVVSLCGIVVYNRLMRRYRERKLAKNSEKTDE